MLPSAHLLTTPTSLANYKPEDLSSTAFSLLSSSYLFLQVDRDLAHEEERMAHPPRPKSRNDDAELWFSMPSSARREHQQTRGPEQSAYQATSTRHSFRRSASPSRFPPIPLISTTTAVNKPLPPSPESEKKKRKPASLRSLIRRRPSDQLDPSHLQPEPYQNHQRSSSANGNLSPTPYQYYYQQPSSRSMPSSPAEYSQASSQVPILARAHSTTVNMSTPTQPQTYPQRSSSTNAYFEPQPPRARRTFPETSTPSSATTRDSISDRPRPHTWLSPTEPFEDASEFHLFVEATSGLSDGGGGFDTLSPNSPPRLQGSLFGRGRQNDRIPIPLQNPPAAQPSQTHPVGGWQTMGYDFIPPQPTDSQMTASALPRLDPNVQSHLTPNMNVINLELERLGLSEEEEAEDELPDYAQSQAEMNAMRRREATDRARELEARHCPWTYIEFDCGGWSVKKGRNDSILGAMDERSDSFNSEADVPADFCRCFVRFTTLIPSLDTIHFGKLGWKISWLYGYGDSINGLVKCMMERRLRMDIVIFSPKFLQYAATMNVEFSLATSLAFHFLLEHLPAMLQLLPQARILHFHYDTRIHPPQTPKSAFSDSYTYDTVGANIPSVQLTRATMKTQTTVPIASLIPAPTHAC
ncbi:uncharacterized protein BDR25DRAFT_354655 [Lindgomyces ingoldianus]|uniref:Uncharacterized protein n=1 Tax=Lindgomyces ingoldianus TaxID=673940 RepID=A0ACB6QWN0_9PLEO|nr:uncharacterized protein BDR25DRAFT_354655 [Lindgomyces ingoldianus]KAF2471418.1 hypothetical protein BDR25DRAFT_354655 [Lindgomyces ingoldianus]